MEGNAGEGRMSRAHSRISIAARGSLAKPDTNSTDTELEEEGSQTNKQETKHSMISGQPGRRRRRDLVSVVQSKSQ